MANENPLFQARTKEDANYRRGKSYEVTCGKCRFYRAPGGDNGCQIVEGSIKPGDTCDLFAAGIPEPDKYAKEFEESKHPRDEGGQFTAGDSKKKRKSASSKRLNITEAADMLSEKGIRLIRGAGFDMEKKTATYIIEENGEERTVDSDEVRRLVEEGPAKYDAQPSETTDHYQGPMPTSDPMDHVGPQKQYDGVGNA